MLTQFCVRVTEITWVEAKLHIREGHVAKVILPFESRTSEIPRPIGQLQLSCNSVAYLGRNGFSPIKMLKVSSLINPGTEFLCHISASLTCM